MSRLELDIRPHTIETSHMSNMTLCPEGISSHSVKLVATLAFLIFCSHLEANIKMLHACSVSTSTFNCDAFFPVKFLLFPRRLRASFCYTVYNIDILIHVNGYLW